MKKHYYENINKLHKIIIRQCTPALKSSIKRDKDYEDKSKDFNTFWLLQKLKIVTAGVDAKANQKLTLHKKTYFFSMRQKNEFNG